ncbi:hypothetical protein [Desulfovibrio gilichinskyi]|uniref:Uncharacterized protein n=1 Tax=Desulfovibrio gilichinskyi TaxID=1519643 RepID=A0A1X7CJ66_9BACT|nr:hypothetical protein [Desulfovibrio gilichinskyi]SME97105.1 hypothetical protein SAMN06295933_0933 [Desulfovibrio gilichinskyi]
MKYIAAMLSIFVHVLIVLILCNNIFPIPEKIVSMINIELVSPAVLKKVNPEPKLKEPVQPEEKNLKPVKQTKSTKHAKHPVSRRNKFSTKDIPDNSQVKAKAKPSHTSANTAESLQSKTSLPKNKPPVAVSSAIESNVAQNKNAIVLKQGKLVTVGNETIVLKRGSEGRTFDKLAAYSFNEDDFRGHYETETGRNISIIDARQEQGRLVLHDQKTGLTRKLKKAGYGDFIYTYGPSFDEDFPVEGSVVFLPGDEHFINRFMWLPAHAAAEYPNKGRVNEVRVSKKVKTDSLFIPESEGVFPAIVIVRFGAAIPDDQFDEVARHLAGKGVVVQIVYLRSSPDNEELNAIAEKLRHTAKVDFGRVGIWFRGYKPQSIPKMPRSLQMFDFALLTIDTPDRYFYPEMVAAVIPENIPLFIGLRNVSRSWEDKVSIMLSGIQSAPHQLVMLDKASSFEAGTDLESIDSLSGDFVSSISAWLDSH